MDIKRGVLTLFVFLIFIHSVIALTLGDSNCGDVISSDSQTYELTEDMTCSGNGIVIEGDNNIIDCKGYSIRGEGSNYGIAFYVISNPGAEGNIVKNCDISNFSFGVYNNYYGMSNTIFNNTIYGNNRAIYLGYGSDFILIDDNEIYNNVNEGIKIEGLADYPNDINLTNNKIYNNSKGIKMSGNKVWYVKILNNTIYDNAQEGIHISGDSYFHIIINNTLSGNGLWSIWTNSGEINVSNNYLDTAYDSMVTYFGNWNMSNVGNKWTTFLENEGYPNNYTVSGGVGAVDYHPISTYSEQINWFKNIQTNFSFDSGTTDFEIVSDYSQIENVSLIKGNQQIQFNNNISFLTDVQLSDYIVMDELGFVSVNMSGLNSLGGNNFEKNVTVTVTVNTCNRVKMYHSSAYVINESEWLANRTICNATTSPVCDFISCSGNLLTFNITHLDGAGGYGQDPVPEFSNITLLLAVLITVFGLIAIRSKNNKY